MTTELWDSHGQAIAYIAEDKESVYLQDGTPVAWITGGKIYNYTGKLLGWLSEGWVFGRDGRCIFFTEHSQPGARKPFRQLSGGRGDRGVHPSRATRESPRKRPERGTLWSPVDARLFLVQ